MESPFGHPPQTKVTTVGKIYCWGNLVGPFLVTTPPLSSLLIPPWGGSPVPYRGAGRDLRPASMRTDQALLISPGTRTTRMFCS